MNPETATKAGVEVHIPPFQTEALEPTGGRIGPEPEHFEVEEVPLYAAVGHGEHWYVRLRKRCSTTPELVRKVARAARVSERDVGYAGLKDKYAVTTQWLSLPGSAQPPESWQLPHGIEVLEASRHTNKLRTGHLAANRFVITLVDVPESGLSFASAIAGQLGSSGLLNYFGAQRFGGAGENLPRALHWLCAPSAPRSRFGDKFYPSVLQSEVFNRYTTLRFGRDLGQLLPGEVVRLGGSRALFRVEEPERELVRLRSGDIELTGPMWGPRMLEATDQALALEAEARQQLGLSQDDLRTLGRFAPGTRRDLLAKVGDINVLPGLPNQLILAFTLPAGSYATQLVREFTRAPFLTPRAEEMETLQANPAAS